MFESIVLEKTTLIPGESTKGSATYTITQADMDRGSVYNEASTTGTPPKGLDKPTDDDDVTITSNRIPGIELGKKADTEIYELGQEVTYTFTVTNTGNVTLIDVVVEDPMFKEVVLEKTTLLPKESTTGTATIVMTQSNVDAGKVYNHAEATGTPPEGLEPPKDDDDVTITTERIPKIELLKEADKEVYKLGEIVTYTFTVTNTGNVTLVDVVVNDPMFEEVVLEKTTLLPGESTTGSAKYTVVEKDVKAGQIENTATTTGTPPQGLTPPTSTDTVVVKVVKPTLPSTGSSTSTLTIVASLMALGGYFLLKKKKED